MTYCVPRIIGIYTFKLIIVFMSLTNLILKSSLEKRINLPINYRYFVISLLH